MTLAAWFHTLSPFIYKNPWVPLRWYGVSYALGFVIGWMLLKFLSRRRACLIPVERVGDAVLIAVMGVVLGGRLGYALFYEPALLWKWDPSTPPWWGLLMINHGGMSSHGGMIGVIIAGFYISRGFKNTTGERVGRAPVLHLLDTMALIAPPGLGLGRLANFINGELLGKIVAMPGQPAPWWAVKFPHEVQTAPMDQGGHAPSLTGDQQTALDALVAPFRLPGRSFDDAYQKVLEQVWSGNTTLAKSLEPLISARHPSQLYQAFTDGIIVLIVVWFVARKPRVPGVVGCWFLISYGILRILTEFYRLPDAQLAVKRFMGLSRGQWLSAAMVVAGVIALPIILARGGRMLGGWLSKSAGEPERAAGRPI
jgi:phosphatidylglycerol:prolipoprotein diacylglycerol transferase